MLQWAHALYRGHYVRRLLGVTAVSFGLALGGCSLSRPPVFEVSRELHGSLLVMAPSIRGVKATGSSREHLAQAVETKLRQAFAGHGLRVVQGAEGEAFTSFRRGVEQAWAKQRVAGARRFRTGADLGLRSLLELPASTGARLAAFVVLAGHGTVSAGEYMPVPPDEIILMPEERPDYVVPKAGHQGIARGVDLDLLLVDLRSGLVVMHRRVSHPASSSGEIYEALPVLVRELTRRLSGVD